MSIQAGRTIKIIVVDDEPISADDMSDVIRDEFGKSMNVDVRTAYNAKSVIKMVEESPCDILLSDIQMPGMTGLQNEKKSGKYSTFGAKGIYCRSKK